MACCINVTCFFATLCGFIGLISLIQLCSGIYLGFIEPDVFLINRLVKTDNFDSYLLYILLVFVGLGLIALILSFLSIYSTVRRLKSLSLCVAILWVFTAALNIVMLIVSLLFYLTILPNLHKLLTRSLQQMPISTPLSTLSYSIDSLQSKYQCCGINGKDDYKNLALDPLPLSCCREPNCWRDTDINNDNGLSNTTSLLHTRGCYPIINKYVTIELWMFIGVAGSCALLEALAIILICSLYQRFNKLDDDPTFIINRLGTGKSMNDSHDNIQGSSKTIEETVEITQI